MDRIHLISDSSSFCESSYAHLRVPQVERYGHLGVVEELCGGHYKHVQLQKYCEFNHS